MSVQHSPKGAQEISDSGSSSQSDLNSLARQECFVKQRKRKQPTSDGDIKLEINMFRHEMMSFFQDFSKTHKENICEIKQDLMEIKQEMKTLKNTNEKLSQDYEKVCTDLQNIKITNKEMQEKIKQMEQNLNSIKSNSNTEKNMNLNLPQLQPPTACAEDIILEFQDRQQRLNNVIIVGIPEYEGENVVLLRQKYDLEKAVNLLKVILPDCPIPIKTIRLGKYNAEKTRPLKVCLESHDIVKKLLRNKSKLSDDQRLYADQTPAQRSYLEQLSAELKRREDEGESNLTIKYIKGIPKIVEKPSKNSEI